MQKECQIILTHESYLKFHAFGMECQMNLYSCNNIRSQIFSKELFNVTAKDYMKEIKP